MQIIGAVLLSLIVLPLGACGGLMTFGGISGLFASGVARSASLTVALIGGVLLAIAIAGVVGIVRMLRPYTPRIPRQ
ncbi:MAG TPA: hypothetical protein VKT77_07540 [Chthonomonadaceae bacterium]|nr:hypothetical protein [Chthonomonadaceae bacterium]